MMDWSEAGQESMTTDVDGRFLVENLASDERASITVQHPGFITCSSDNLMPTPVHLSISVLEHAARCPAEWRTSTAIRSRASWSR